MAQVAGGDRALIQQVVDGAVAWLGDVLPPEYRASAAKSGEIALAAADEILRLRRTDPARAGEATIEREIETRKRGGRAYRTEDRRAAH